MQRLIDIVRLKSYEVNESRSIVDLLIVVVDFDTVKNATLFITTKLVIFFALHYGSAIVGINIFRFIALINMDKFDTKTEYYKSLRDRH